MKELRAHKIKTALSLREIFTKMLQHANIILAMQEWSGPRTVARGAKDTGFGGRAA